MVEHLELLFGRALTGRIEVTSIHTDKTARHHPRTRFFAVDDFEGASAFAAEVNAEPGWNTYVGAALRSEDVFPGKAATDDDFLRAYAVWADADDDTQLASARTVYRGMGATPPFIVVTGRTPTKRAQMWWPLEEPIDDIGALRAQLRGIALGCGTDPKVCTGKQLMRLAGTVNWPKKDDRVLERTEIVRVERAAREFPAEQLARAFPPRAASDVAEVGADVVVAPSGSLGLDEKIMDGREGYAFRLVRAHLHELIGTTGSEPTPDELYRFVAPTYLKKVDQVRAGRGPDFLKAKCSEALRAFESGSIPFMRSLDEAVVSYAGRQGPVAETDGDDDSISEHNQFTEAVSPRGLIAGSDFAGRPIEPRPWFVPDMIPGRQVTTLDGDGGLGKSTLGLQVCIAAATGREWLNQRVEGGPTIYLAAEDDEQEIHRRLQNLCVHYKVGLEDLTDVHIWPLAECDPALVTATRDDTVVPTERWRELERFIEGIKPIAVVLDSRADVFGGNEISRSQARGFIGMLRALAVRHHLAVVLLAHPSLSGMSSGTGSSGSTHWRNSVRAALYLTRPEAADGGEMVDPDARVLTVKKSNYGPSGLSLKLRWSVGSFVVDGAENGHILPQDRAAASAGVDIQFLQMLALYNSQGRHVSDKPGASFAPVVFARDPAADATKSGFAAAMNRLFAANQIRVEIIGPPSRQVRRLIRSFGEVEK